MHSATSPFPPGAGRAARRHRPRTFLTTGLVSLVLSVGAAPAVAAPPVLLGDLATEAPAPEWVGSAPRPMVAFGPAPQRMLVVAEDARHGREPWVSDGTPAGTRLLADLCPGVCGSYPDHALAVGERLIFGALDASGPWLWGSDGTDGGTVQLTQGFVQAVVALDGTAYAVVDPPALGSPPRRELWATDGTLEGTRKVLELCEGMSCAWYPVPLAAASGVVYFAASRPETGVELWSSDGTTAGSHLVADLCPGPCDTYLAHLVPFQGRLFFFVGGSPLTSELWATDPGGATAARIASIGNETVRSPTATDRFLYFLVGQHDIWVSDGTPAGTGARIGGAPTNDWIRALGETVLFADEIPDGHRLSRIEPTADHFDLTRLVSGLSAAPTAPTAAGPEIFFVASDPARGRELWATRGTVATTRAVTDFPAGELLTSGPAGFLAALGDRVLFEASEPGHGRELWVSDGTPASFRLVRDLNPAVASSFPRGLSGDGARVTFVADGDGVDGGLWRTDGTAGSTELLEDSTRWRRTLAAGGQIFALGGAPERLAGVDGDQVTELATLSGNEGRQTAVLGDRLFIGTFGHGQELWVSDGTAEGTRLVVDVNPDWSEECNLSPCPPIRGLPDELTPAGDRLFFVAQSPDATAPDLWTSDGSTEGTRRVVATAGLAVGIGLAALDGAVAFPAFTEEDGSEVWVSDGTAAGTRALTDLPDGLTPRQIVSAAGGALFTVRDAAVHDQLWRTDGTPEGTVEVSDLERAGAASRVWTMVPAGDPAQPAQRGRGAYLVVDNPALGRELWWSDGTAAGTGPIADLHPGPRGSNPEPLVTADDGRLLFAAEGDAAGYALWITDATADGTERLTDLAPRPLAVDPTPAALVGGRVVLGADDGEHGVEPWALDLPRGSGPPGPPPPPPSPPPSPPNAPPLTSEAVPGFRVWVRITAQGDAPPILGTRVAPCIPETLCVAGSLPDRAEVFVRVVGPKPNGRLWPTLVKFSTSTVEIWIEQVRTGDVKYYRLEGARPGFDELPGLFDRDGFAPPA